MWIYKKGGTELINVLCRIFVKNYKDTKNPKVRLEYGIFAGIVGIICNIVLFLTKLTAGFLTSSLSIMADAINNLSDAGSSIVTLAGFKLASKPADSEHPYGHGRIEYISGLFVAVMIILMAYELIKDSIGKILHPELPKFSSLVAVILVVSIGVKIYMYFYNRSIGRKIESATMIATAKDSLSDTFSTMVVLASAIEPDESARNLGYCGLLVGVMILIAGITAMKDTVSPLLGQAPEPELVDEIEKIVRCDKRILGIHDLVVHDYGPGRLMVSLHAEVPYKEDILELHDLIDQIEFSLRKELNCEPVIHMDPIVDDDEETNAAKARITEIIESLNKDSRKNENVQFHDFRMVKGSTHSNLIFDVVLPHGYQMSEEQIISYIKEKVSEYNKNYYCVIHIDRAYVK